MVRRRHSKLPGFIWNRYPGEKHFPSYNYLGPGTRLDIRLNDPKPGEEPINTIDHLAYQRLENIEDRHRADQEMINGLKQLKDLSIPRKLIRAMIIKLFQVKVKLGQGERAAKTQAIENLYVSKGAKALPYKTDISQDRLSQQVLI